jgi:hypothetical protein
LRTVTAPLVRASAAVSAVWSSVMASVTVASVGAGGGRRGVAGQRLHDALGIRDHGRHLIRELEGREGAMNGRGRDAHDVVLLSSGCVTVITESLTLVTG